MRKKTDGEWGVEERESVCVREEKEVEKKIEIYNSEDA